MGEKGGANAAVAAITAKAKLAGLAKDLARGRRPLLHRRWRPIRTLVIRPYCLILTLHPVHECLRYIRVFPVVLWDTGINDAVADPARADDYWGKGLPAAFGTHNFTRQHAVDKQLEKLGYKPADVRYVVYSHLHLDHAGGMSYFPNAIHIVQRDEIRYALWPDQWTKPVYCQNDFADIRKLNIFEIDGDYDLFNDGTMKLVKTPGHSPGLQILLLDLPNRGRICLAADTGHQRDGFENMVPMPWDWSTSSMTLTRQRIKQLERSGVPCFFCHDGGDFAKLPQNGQYWD